jgi:peptide/nickel transport system permease protein
MSTSLATRTGSSTEFVSVSPRRPRAQHGWLTMSVRRYLRNRVGVVALVVLLVIVGASVAAPLIAPFEPLQMQPSAAMSGPSPEHWLGTDRFGRDTFSRVLYGGQLTLQVAFISALLSAVIGVSLGLVAGYCGGRVDEVIARLIDVLLAFPGIMLALAVVAVLQPGLRSIILAVGISGIPYFVRVTRASATSVKHEMYVEAARVCGASDCRIAMLHILPNVAAPILVLLTLSAVNAVLTGASLSFLGLGVQPPTPEWGAMMNAGRDFIRQAPWLINGPGLVLMVTVLAISTVGDALRDALDPRLKGI